MCRIRDQRGVTLVEMVIVSVIIGIVAAMAAPTWLEVLPRIRAKSEVRAMLSSLREARSLAISTRVPHGVNFDYATNEFTLFADVDNPALQSFSAGDSILTHSELDHGVSICYDTFAGTVIFQADGSATNSGQVCISTEDYMFYYTIDILASTGRVRADEGYPGYVVH
ncbi:MAG TPA: GspH/FimT family pseudopilin [Acidobacteriota bacterium]|nr:GspH/FimT family pseudopilin [Acidobacteriota bacterium]